MKNETVAILDIRSGEVSFFLGAKGVNDTFVFSAGHTESYEGYCVGGFFDEASFRDAITCVVTSVKQNYKGTIGRVYVSIPSPFVRVATKGHTLAFPSKRKISAQDVDALFESGLNELAVNGRCIRRSAMYLTLGDNRKYFKAEDLYGVATDVLKGALCYYFVEDHFHRSIDTILKELQCDEACYVPSTLAQSLYLLPDKKREGYAFLLDIGFLTTSISVVYGNGIVHEESFNCGVATVLIALMQTFDVDYSMAEEILATSNISGGNVPKGVYWSSEAEEKQISVQEINDCIKFSLDELCEKVDKFFAVRYLGKVDTIFTVNPISITGEGISRMKGVAEHISKRLNHLTEIVAPDLPYYDKPTFSSRIALLNDATNDAKKRGWKKRLFGGRKK
ncbi:MAG: cell division FtsA domain-containing protein [Clostridia bacterium]|nr:cell division FtsA domain-containing protein [Clostridia bacterium]